MARSSRHADRLVTDQFRSAFDHAMIGMAIIGLDGRYERVNDAFGALLGYPDGALVGRTFMSITHPDDLEVDLVSLEEPALLDRPRWVEKRYVRSDGSVVWALVKATLVTDDDGEPHSYFTQIQDISDKKRAEALSRAALRDPLTGLGNRTLLADRLEHALDRLERTSDPLAILFIDLDGFKNVNDQFGHDTGDAVLVEVARRLATVTRAADTSVRLGGDEFVVVCEELADAGEAWLLAERLVTAIGAPIDLPGRGTVTITASMGVVIAEPGDAADDLLRAADHAMYVAKSQGKGRWVMASASAA